MMYLFARVALIGKCWPDVYSDGSWVKLILKVTPDGSLEKKEKQIYIS